MTDVKPIRTALIGLGRIAWMLERDALRYHPCTHAGTIREWNRIHRARNRFDSEIFHLAGICDINPDRMESFLHWWRRPVDFTSTDSARVLMESKPELVILAASLDSHYEILSEAAHLEIPAIVVEKPVSENGRLASWFLNRSKQNGTRVWVNFERRYHPDYIRTKEWIESGRLGRIRSIRGQVLTGGGLDPATGTGPLLHDAVHWIDLLLWYAGVPQSVQSRISRNCPPGKERIEESAFINFVYPDFQAYLESGSNRDYFEFQMQIDFDRGRIITGNDGHIYYETAPSGKYSNFRELKPITPESNWFNPWLRLYEEVFQTLRPESSGSMGGGEAIETISLPGPISSDLQNAVQGLRLIDRCYAGLRHEGKP